jgi:hypothetical protein
LAIVCSPQLTPLYMRQVIICLLHTNWHGRCTFNNRFGRRNGVNTLDISYCVYYYYYTIIRGKRRTIQRRVIHFNAWPFNLRVQHARCIRYICNFESSRCITRTVEGTQILLIKLSVEQKIYDCTRLHPCSSIILCTRLLCFVFALKCNKNSLRKKLILDIIAENENLVRQLSLLKPNTSGKPFIVLEMKICFNFDHEQLDTTVNNNYKSILVINDNIYQLTFH